MWRTCHARRLRFSPSAAHHFGIKDAESPFDPAQKRFYPPFMPTSKEEIRRKYGLSDEEFDVVEALALRPVCEHCNKSLSPDSLEARICSFECTFCATCVDTY